MFPSFDWLPSFPHDVERRTNAMMKEEEEDKRIGRALHSMMLMTHLGYVVYDRKGSEAE